MITTAELNSHTKADLTAIAKRLGLAVTSSMRKADLVEAVAKQSRAQTRSDAKSSASAKSSSPKSSASKSSASKSVDAQLDAGKNGAKKNGTAKNGVAKATAAKRGGGKNGAAKTGGGQKESPARSAPKKRASSSKASDAASSKTAVASGPQLKSAKAKTPASPKATASSRASGSKSRKAAATRAEAKPKSSSPSTKAALQAVKSESVPAAKPKKLVAKKKEPKKSTTSPAVLKRIRDLQLQKEKNKDIAFRPTLVRPPGAAEPIWEKEPQQDRVALFVRDAYWMHAAWDITRSAIERARASMAEQWHSAKPVLRLLRLDDGGTTSASETVQRDIEIHGGLRNWYIDWTGEAARFRAMVGYLSPNGRFHVIARSNIVRTPEGGSTDEVDEHWSDTGADGERILALSGGYDGEQETGEMKEILENRLHRELGAPALARLGAGADATFRRRGDFHFDMDVELVVYGSTTPDCYLTLSGEPVALRPDGTFVMRLPFPDRRQVLPAVACSRDGSQQRTIVVAVERNTKVMAPLGSERDTNE